MFKNLQMQNKELKDETKADSKQMPIVASPAQMPQNPLLGAVSSDIKDNKIMLLEEDLWCVHKYLDDLELPRNDKNNQEYSIVGRIKSLEKRYFKNMSELESMYLSVNCT